MRATSYRVCLQHTQDLVKIMPKTRLDGEFGKVGTGAKAYIQFYCVNTSCPMDNCFTGHHDRSHQTPEKDILYRIVARPVRSVHLLGGASYFLSRQCDVIASFLFGAWSVWTCFQFICFILLLKYQPSRHPRTETRHLWPCCG